MIIVQLNFRQVLHKLEEMTSHRWSYTTIAELSGLSRQTITKLFEGHANAVDLQTLGKLLTFFDAQGMPIAISDLFTVVEVDAHELD